MLEKASNYEEIRIYSSNSLLFYYFLIFKLFYFHSITFIDIAVFTDIQSLHPVDPLQFFSSYVKFNIVCQNEFIQLIISQGILAIDYIHMLYSERL